MASNKLNDSVDEVVLAGVLSVLTKHNKRSQEAWVGTMTELNSALVRVLSKKNSVVLPKSPSALRTVMNRVVNRLRSRKVSVRFGRTSDHTRTRYVEFTTR